MKRILGVFNSISETTIPVENFVILDDKKFYKKIITFNSTFLDAHKCINQKGDFGKIEILSLFHYKIKLLNPLFYFHLIKYINSFNPEIIHVHHTSSALTTLLIRFFLKNKTRIILTMHNDFRFYKFSQKVIFYICIKLCDYVVANSKNTLNRISKFKNPSLCSVIYNGVDIKKFSKPRKKFKDKLLIGTVGRVVPQKDYITLIYAIDYLINNLNFKSFNFVLIGTGSSFDEIKKLVNKLKLNEFVEMKGFMPRNEVSKFLSMIDIFVISSKFEGFCNAMVEAMISGCAIVTTNAKPLPEVIGGAENGLITDVGNHKLLAESIFSLAKNQKLRQDFSKKSKKFASQNYSLKYCSEQHAKLYYKIL